jgi:hypothetical protein
MKNRCALFVILGALVLLAACAHVARGPAVDRSSGVDLAALADRFRTPRCEVSVPLSQVQALALAEREGVPYPETRTDWIAFAAAIQPGDQLRQVSCLSRGNVGRAAGVVFFGLFRGNTLVAQMHPMIIN